MVFTQLCSTSHLASDGMDFKTMHAFAFHMCHLVLSFSSPAAQYVGLEIWVRKFSVGRQKKLTNIWIELHKTFICFLFNDKATFLSLQLPFYWDKDALKEMQKTFEILQKLIFEVYFSYFHEQNKYIQKLIFRKTKTLRKLSISALKCTLLDQNRILEPKILQ